MKFIYVLSTLLCVGKSFVFAQSDPTDSLLVLEEVVIYSNRLKSFSTGSKIELIDSTTLAHYNNNTLADLLSNQSQVFVKSYGIAGLSSPSFRGTNASQTAILWNGFNIGSPMNGGLDLSLMPVNFVNNVKLQFGGAAALWGSGAVGGAIHLNNIPEFNKGFFINSSSSLGSFEDRQQNVEVGISNKKLISITKFFYHEAKNNFPYINTSAIDKPIQTMKNAEMYQKGILQENYFKINSTQNLSFRFWYQTNNRYIPASISLSESKANQKDDALRCAAEWQQSKTKVTYFIRAAYFDEKLNYTNSDISLLSDNRSKAFITEAETKIDLNQLHALNIGINNTFNKAITKNYAANPEQNRTSFFGAYRMHNKKSTIIATVSARQEIISNGQNPFTASLGLQSFLLKNIKIRISASKNYRIPTFNDLYWRQGGNPYLKPEEGFNEEIGLAYILFREKTELEIGATVFNSNINNWIMWVPDNSGVWSPKNIQKVWSRGIENDIKLYYKLGKTKINIITHYQYILTTNEQTEKEYSASLHKQLFYTPTHKSNATLSVDYRNFRISLTYNYVGYRYSSSDNNPQSIMDPYHTFNFDIRKTIKITNTLFSVFAQANNFTNESYQTILNYATPGRSFQFGVTINFNKPNK